MKFCIALLSVLLLQVIAIGQDLNIKTEQEIRYDKEGEIWMEIHSEFDKTGFLLKRTIYDSNKKLRNYRISTANTDGETAIDTNYNSDKSVEEILQYSYDEKGTLINQKRHFPQRDAYYEEQFVVTYDNQGNKVELLQFDKDSVFQWKYIYEYNANNERIKFVSAYQGTIRNERNYKYEKGKLIENFLYDFENDELKKEANTLEYFKYNRKGVLLQKEVHSVAAYLKEPIISVYELNYSKKGLLLEKIETRNGLFHSRTIYKYTFYQ